MHFCAGNRFSVHRRSPSLKLNRCCVLQLVYTKLHLPGTVMVQTSTIILMISDRHRLDAEQMLSCNLSVLSGGS